MTIFLLCVLGIIGMMAATAAARRGRGTDSRRPECPRYMMLAKEPPPGVRGSIRTLVQMPNH